MSYRGQRTMPNFRGKNHYLVGVKSKGSAKDKITGCYLMQDIEIQNKSKTNKTKSNKNVKKQEKKQKNNKNMNEWELKKAGRKAKYNNSKRTMKEVWTIEMESEEDKGDIQSLPSHFKRYIVQDRKIVVQQPIKTS